MSDASKVLCEECGRLVATDNIGGNYYMMSLPYTRYRNWCRPCWRRTRPDYQESTRRHG